MMVNLPQSRVEETVNRFARGELSPQEARELAQASLESPDLFGELTATALAKTAAARVPAYAEHTRIAWWRPPLMLAAASAFAVLIIAAVLVTRFELRPKPSREMTTQQLQATAPALKPTLTFSAESTQPILIAEDLQQATGGPVAPVFRGEEQRARAPRQTGSVILIEDGFATFDLGSIDGLAKGSEVEVFRDKGLRKQVARLRVSTVFREQARAPLANGNLELHAAVKVSDSTHLSALLQQVDDLEVRGARTQAHKVAERARSWAETANLAAGERGSLLRRLAALDFQAGDLDSAAAHYRAALDIFNTDHKVSSEVRTATENDLATLAILRGDNDLAGRLLEQATFSPNEKLNATRLNNLGVLAEVRGDRKNAEIFYSRALEALSTVQNASQDRRIVNANVTRIKGLH